MSGFTIIVIMLLVMLASVAIFLLAADESELATEPEVEPFDELFLEDAVVFDAAGVEPEAEPSPAAGDPDEPPTADRAPI